MFDSSDSTSIYQPFTKEWVDEYMEWWEKYKKENYEVLDVSPKGDSK